MKNLYGFLKQNNGVKYAEKVVSDYGTKTVYTVDDKLVKKGNLEIHSATAAAAPWSTKKRDCVIDANGIAMIGGKYVGFLLKFNGDIGYTKGQKETNLSIDITDMSQMVDRKPFEFNEDFDDEELYEIVQELLDKYAMQYKTDAKHIEVRTGENLFVIDGENMSDKLTA